MNDPLQLYKWAGIDDGLQEKQYDGRIFDASNGELLFDVPPDYREQIVADHNAAVDARSFPSEGDKELLAVLTRASEALRVSAMALTQLNEPGSPLGTIRDGMMPAWREANALIERLGGTQ